MSFDFVMKMLGKNLENNQAIQQLLILKNMLDKLPEEKQLELISDFVSKLQEAVKESEERKEENNSSKDLTN